jgi:DNA-binding FadR family transcriptional regulator
VATRHSAYHRGARRNQQTLEEAIKQLILSSGLQPGDPVPTEAELALELNVSRNTVREALKSLEALDIVEIRHGYGTRMGQLSLKPLADRLTFQILLGQRDGMRRVRELLEIREMFEAQSVRQVATNNITDAEIQGLERIVQRMDQHAKRHRWNEQDDRSFHKMLHRSLNNSLLIELLDTFWVVFQRVSPELREPLDMASEADRHRAIIKAVARQDPDLAERALFEHFQPLHTSLQALSRERGR